MPNGAAAVQIDAEGASVATTRLWRFRDQLRVTVIVKATFSLVHQGLMKVARPDPIFTADIHHGNNPLRTVRYSSDMAPYLPATDVLLTGHAYAPSGERATWVTAGIAILDGYEPVFEKYLDVRGDPETAGRDVALPPARAGARWRVRPRGFALRVVVPNGVKLRIFNQQLGAS